MTIIYNYIVYYNYIVHIHDTYSLRYIYNSGLYYRYMMLECPQSYSTTLSHNPKFLLYVCKCSSLQGMYTQVYVHVTVESGAPNCVYKCQTSSPP